jgi:ketosteroid isomerase-like protein
MRSLITGLMFVCFIFVGTNAAAEITEKRSGIESFNRELDAATKSMNNAAVLALWEDDGISLLPSTPPIVGKKAIGKFLDDVTARYPGGRMEGFEMECHDITVSGDWGYEWCTEHQVVQFPGSKTPFEGWGKMLLVLHRHKGKWRLKEEMWNQAVAPQAAAR